MTDLYYVEEVAHNADDLPSQCGQHGVGFDHVSTYGGFPVFRYVGTMGQLLAFFLDAYGMDDNEGPGTTARFLRESAVLLHVESA